MNFDKEIEMYEKIHRSKGYKEAYKFYSRSKYLYVVWKRMIKVKRSCHFCGKTYGKMFVFPFEIKPFEQTIFQDVVLACYACRKKNLSVEKLYPPSLKYRKKLSDVEKVSHSINTGLESVRCLYCSKFINEGDKQYEVTQQKSRFSKIEKLGFSCDRCFNKDHHQLHYKLWVFGAELRK